MERRTIAVDCDDVIVPTAGLIIAHYNKTYGTQLHIGDMYSTDLELWGVTDRAVAVARVDVYLETEEYQRAEPFTEAVAIVRALARHHDLHVVTGRADFLAEATAAMLMRYFPDIFQSIAYTNFFGNTPKSKADVCRELGADLLIDDHLHHAQLVASAGIDVLLFGDYPWNRAEQLPPNIRRVQDWHEVAKRLLPR